MAESIQPHLRSAQNAASKMVRYCGQITATRSSVHLAPPRFGHHATCATRCARDFSRRPATEKICLLPAPNVAPSLINLTRLYLDEGGDDLEKRNSTRIAITVHIRQSSNKSGKDGEKGARSRELLRLMVGLPNRQCENRRCRVPRTSGEKQETLVCHNSRQARDLKCGRVI